MKDFMVQFTATGWLEARAYVKAENEETAKALAKVSLSNGDIPWKYDGVDDSSITITDVTKV